MRGKKYTQALHHLKWDVVVILFSILLAVIVVEAGLLSNLLSFSQNLELVSAFISGIFFTSLFTVAAASMVFVELGNPSNIILISIVGALGATFGDVLLFLFIRDTVIEDVKVIMKPASYKKILRRFHGGVLRWLAPVLGAIVIASPLPDELGVALLGVSKMRSIYIVPITFVMNFFGIWAIISITNAL